MHSGSSDLSVAIVGGGLCGIVCGYALSKAGITVNIYEANKCFEEIGAGVGIGPNAVRALKVLGVLDAVLARPGVPQPSTARRMIIYSAFDRHDLIYDYPALEEDVGFSIYRPTFLEAITELLDPAIIHFDKRCAGVASTEGGATVRFADGTFVTASLVIGADGVRSVTRKFVQKDEGVQPLKFTNTLAYRAMVSHKELKSAGLDLDLSTRVVCLVGTGKSMVLFSVKGGEFINVVAFVRDLTIPMAPPLTPPWVVDVPEDEISNEFRGWGHDATLVLERMKKANKWLVHALNPPLEEYTKDSVVLIGDAAHAMLPHLGAGAGQGFEDVAVLVRLIEGVTSGRFALENALQGYSRVRSARANMVLSRSTAAGELYESYEPGNEKEMLHHLTGLWDHVWHHDLEKEIKELINILEQ